MKNIRLPSGHEIPIFGLGTWQLKDRQCERIVKEAITLGYTHIDTAWMYQNQRAIGKALRDIRVDREDIFLTTKIWGTHLRHADVLAQFEECLSDLQMDYVDLLLIHHPSRDSVPVAETFEAFQKLYAAGQVKSIGISNFSIAQVEEACEASELPICTNQVEYHVRNNRSELRDYCHERGIVMTAHRPLAVGDLAGDAVLRSIGENHKKTAAQVALRWLVQQDIITIPKSGSVPHLRENLDVFAWELTDEEMDMLNTGM
ncbi:MAG: aldo/keto reductase [Candidatus Poribacteria bacterium]|nr:aldo/keto reductase [Candidatus Poribacteria bacterium]